MGRMEERNDPHRRDLPDFNRMGTPINVEADTLAKIREWMEGPFEHGAAIVAVFTPSDLMGRFDDVSIDEIRVPRKEFFEKLVYCVEYPQGFPTALSWMAPNPAGEIADDLVAMRNAVRDALGPNAFKEEGTFFEGEVRLLKRAPEVFGALSRHLLRISAASEGALVDMDIEYVQSLRAIDGPDLSKEEIHAINDEGYTRERVEAYEALQEPLKEMGVALAAFGKEVEPS